MRGARLGSRCFHIPIKSLIGDATGHLAWLTAATFGVARSRPMLNTLLRMSLVVAGIAAD